MTGQVLIFDADDTLWENNVRFERVIADYLAWLDHPTLAPAEIRVILDDIEAANARVHGYGSAVFLRNLAECFQRLYRRPADAAERAELDALVADLIDHRVELLPGVVDTLTELAGRHELLLLTKGDPVEQRGKLVASNLARFFRQAHVVAEKDLTAYRWLTEAYRLAPERTWMIGNSPKSDIIPARQAGLGAVFIPHRHTWALEDARLDPADPRVLRLAGFAELTSVF